MNSVNCNDISSELSGKLTCMHLNILYKISNFFPEKVYLQKLVLGIVSTGKSEKIFIINDFTILKQIALWILQGKTLLKMV